MLWSHCASPCSPARLGLAVSTAVLLKSSPECHPLPWPRPPPKATLPVPQPPTGSGLAAGVRSYLLAFTLALEACRIPFLLAVALLGLSASPLLPSPTLQHLGTSLLPPCAPTSPGQGPGGSSCAAGYSRLRGRGRAWPAWDGEGPSSFSQETSPDSLSAGPGAREQPHAPGERTPALTF